MTSNEEGSISKFRCIECGKEHGIKETIYKCCCGGLLEVITDFSEFKRSGKEWKKFFDKRKNLPAFIRYKDLLLPQLPEEKIISLKEGDTPLYRANKGMQDCFGIKKLVFKHEGMNPTLSFKDRGMVAGVSWAKYLGKEIVACASTGDTSAAMAAYAAYAEIKSVVLIPHEKISTEQLAQAISYNAKVVALKTDFDGCMRIVKELTEKHSIYLLNSMNSIRIEGQKAIGIELLHQLEWEVPDWIVVPVGNAGNISAIGKGIRELYELGIIDSLPRLVGVQAESANPVYLSYKKGFEDFKAVEAKPTAASAIRIGNPVSFKKAAREIKYFKGVVEVVSEKELMDAKAKVDASGISICPNSGVAAAGAKKLADANVIGKDESVVVIATAHGSKFSKAAIEYHTANNKFSNKPIIIEAELANVERVLGV